MAVIGIDLGTTNSLGAVYRNHRVELIPNRFGSFLTPSVVSIAEDGSILVGEIAKERLVTHPDSTAASFKKDMGTSEKYMLGKQAFLPEELSSFVIRSIIEDAKEYLGEEIEEAVISVPAYFHDMQRVATKRAGALAGITVNRIINEPSAAALASYFDTSTEQLFLIFDFGGGTLDVSIVDCFDTMVEIVSVSGDNRLGGDNFHEIMADRFLEEHQIARKYISEKEYAVLLKQAELCKRKLTTEESAKMSAVIGGSAYQSVYTNERLMEESASILSRIKKVLTHALKDGNLSIREIDAVVMVGGSSKMPLIQSYMQHLFRQAPLVTGNCDEMIARGLGLVCAVKERQEDVKDFVLTDICPFTLGVDTHNEADPEHSYMTPIIERNTVLPCSRVKRFYTANDYQNTIQTQILQGEHPYAEDNLELEKIRVVVPRKKKGEESVDVRFTYDINGILIVDLTVVSTGNTIRKVISQKMSDADLANKVKELEKLKVHPKEKAENKLLMEKLLALYEEAPMEQREMLHSYIAGFEHVLARQKSRQIRHYRAFLEQILTQMEDYDPFAETMWFPEYEEPEDDEWPDDEWTESTDQDDRWKGNSEDSDEESEEDEIFGGNGKWTS